VKDFLLKWQKWVGLGGGTSLLILIGYCALLNYTEPTQAGIARNYITGDVWLQETGGWHITAPWVVVVKIDTRPIRVEVSSAGRGYNAKLVQFNVRGWREFVATEGFWYYWWANRLSFNFGYHEEHRGMKDILRGYAYTGRRYPFILILNEYQQSQ
jgi:hypothetical protein